ncbi:MAG: hypothetical protein BroJett011_76490 [Chloroflexota bacterium]|nr:MAG: hypothetical protein BroJett011_76490 [Chloroflexota bacterium]
MSHKEHLKTLVLNLTRRLQILEERKALYGLEASPTILLEIEDVKSQIAEKQAELAQLQDEEKQTLAAYLKTETLLVSPDVIQTGLTSHPPSELPAETTIEDMIQLLEAERQRLATLLESNVISTLKLLLAQANIYEQSLRSNPAAQTALVMLITLARQLYQQIEDLTKNLHPTMLEKLGLAPALESLTSQEMRVHGLQITLAFEALPERLPPPIELALFRAAQEALEQAIQQAQTSYITIQLKYQDEHLIFRLGVSGPTHPIEPGLPATRRYLEQLGGIVKTGLNPSGEFETVIIIALSPNPKIG